MNMPTWPESISTSLRLPFEMYLPVAERLSQDSVLRLCVRVIESTMNAIVAFRAQQLVSFKISDSIYLLQSSKCKL